MTEVFSFGVPLQWSTGLDWIAKHSQPHTEHVVGLYFGSGRYDIVHLVYRKCHGKNIVNAILNYI
jgi:hypothetical protein